MLSLCVGLPRAEFLRTLAMGQDSSACWPLGKSHAQKKSPRALNGCLHPCDHVKTKEYLKRRTWKVSGWSRSWFQLCFHYLGIQATVSSLWALYVLPSQESSSRCFAFENCLGLCLFVNLFGSTFPFSLLVELRKLIFLIIFEKCLTHSWHFMHSVK